MLQRNPRCNALNPHVSRSALLARRLRKGLIELGKALRTTFVFRYLSDIQLRIHEGLNVVENWNAANDFILYGRRGEVSSNRREDQEATVLSLHLLQNCMVFVNTLMIQRVLGDPIWPRAWDPPSGAG